MVDVTTKMAVVAEMRAKGYTEREIEDRLEELDAVADQQDQARHTHIAEGRLRGQVNVPDSDQQDNAENAKNARLMSKGLYSPSLSQAPDALHKQAEDRVNKLRATMGFGPTKLKK